MATKKRRGRQTPTVGFTLSDENTTSCGPDAVKIYNKCGRKAQEWQTLVLFHMLALNKEKKWLHTRFGYSVPRQNGKNEIVAIRELYGLRHGERILHTAHRTATSRAAWDRLIFILEGIGIREIKGDIKSGYTSGKSKGQEFIQLSEEFGGGKISFRTRTTTGGLGETFDLLVIDEAQEYQEDQESALKYTIVSSENPQIIFLGTPPTLYSSGTIFPNMRRKILCGAMKNAGWVEWSVEDETDPECVDAWYDTNPSLGYKLTERAIEDEIGEDKIDFNIQRLGLWLKYNQKSAISKHEWDELLLATVPDLKGPLCVGIKYAKDGGSCSLSVAGKTKDESIFVETIACRSMRDGTDWILSFLLQLNGNYAEVIVDGANGVELLQTGMKDVKLRAPIIPTTMEFIQANARFEQLIFSKKILHMDQKSVENIVTNCEKRAIGSSGGFGYKSIRVGVDVSILDSIILASWGCEKFSKVKKKQRISY